MSGKNPATPTTYKILVPKIQPHTKGLQIKLPRKFPIDNQLEDNSFLSMNLIPIFKTKFRATKNKKVIRQICSSRQTDDKDSPFPLP